MSIQSYKPYLIVDGDITDETTSSTTTTTTQQTQIPVQIITNISSNALYSSYVEYNNNIKLYCNMYHPIQSTRKQQQNTSNGQLDINVQFTKFSHNYVNNDIKQYNNNNEIIIEQLLSNILVNVLDLTQYQYQTLPIYILVVDVGYTNENQLIHTILCVSLLSIMAALKQQNTTLTDQYHKILKHKIGVSQMYYNHVDQQYSTNCATNNNNNDNIVDLTLIYNTDTNNILYIHSNNIHSLLDDDTDTIYNNILETGIQQCINSYRLIQQITQIDTNDAIR